MKSFSLPMRDDTDRPVVYLSLPYRLTALLDTGAVFPVWTQEEPLLKSFGAVLLQHNVPFGGFGGMTTGHLYRIPNFCIGEMIVPSLPVIVSPRRLPCQLLLSATVFSRLIYEIDDQNHTLNVNVPDTESLIRNLNIVDENGRLHVFCTSA